METHRIKGELLATNVPKFHRLQGINNKKNKLNQVRESHITTI